MNSQLLQSVRQEDSGTEQMIQIQCSYVAVRSDTMIEFQYLLSLSDSNPHRTTSVTYSEETGV